MDFIERIFHISPDHGTATLETAVLLLFFAIPVATMVVRMILKRRGLGLS